MLWAISGGAGFLGLHLARRLLADGHAVRTLDIVPLDEPELERSVQELRGDVREPWTARDLRGQRRRYRDAARGRPRGRRPARDLHLVDRGLRGAEGASDRRGRAA